MRIAVLPIRYSSYYKDKHLAWSIVEIEEKEDVPLKYSTLFPFRMPSRTFGPAFARKKSTTFFNSCGARFLLVFD